MLTRSQQKKATAALATSPSNNEPAAVVSSSGSNSNTSEPRVSTRTTRKKTKAASNNTEENAVKEFPLRFQFPFQVRSNIAINSTESNPEGYKSLNYSKIRLTPFFIAAYGQQMKDRLINEGKTIRTLYELLGAQQQCNATLGKFVEGSLCWICGYPIISQNICEHILPICQATIFWKLYKPGLEKNAAQFEKAKLEYEWAHRICNALKSDISLIKKGDSNTYVIDEEAIREELLTPIMYRFNDEPVKRRPPNSTFDETWLESRVKPISDRVSLLLNKINEAPEANLLMGLTSALDVRQFERPARELLTGITEVYAPWKNLLVALPTHDEALALHTKAESIIKKSLLPEIAEQLHTVYDGIQGTAEEIKEAEYFKQMFEAKRRIYRTEDIFSFLKDLFFNENFISIYFDFPYYLIREISMTIPIQYEINNPLENINTSLFTNNPSNNTRNTTNYSNMPPLEIDPEQVEINSINFATEFARNQILKYLSKHSAPTSKLTAILLQLFIDSSARLLKIYKEQYEELNNPKLKFIFNKINKDYDFETLMNMMIIELVPTTAYDKYPWLGGRRKYSKTRRHKK